MNAAVAAPLKAVEADTAAVMPEIGQRARKAARARAGIDSGEELGARGDGCGDSRPKAEASSPPMPTTSPRPRNGPGPAFLDRLTLDASASRRWRTASR